MAKRRKKVKRRGFRYIFIRLTLIAIMAGAAYCYQQQPPERQQQIRSHVEGIYDRCYGLVSEKLTGDYGERYCFGGTPVTSSKVRILKNTGYLAGYSEERRCPLWVAYKVYDDPAQTATERPEGFDVDHRTRSATAVKLPSSRPPQAPTKARSSLTGIYWQICGFAYDEIKRTSRARNQTLDGWYQLRLAELS